MNIAICDDDTIYGLYLVEMCRELSISDTVDYYETPTELLDVISTSNNYDVLLMDIVFKTEKNGIDYMAELYTKCPTIHIIYITAYTDHYVSKAFLQKTNISGFLQKPINSELLLKTLQTIYKKIRDDRTHLVLFQGKRPIKTVLTKDIQYLESSAHKAFIYTESPSGTELEQNMTYEQLNALQRRLPPNFCACHKSYLINMDKIVRIERTEVILSSGRHIAVSKKRLKDFREHYFDYIQNETMK